MAAKREQPVNLDDRAARSWYHARFSPHYPAAYPSLDAMPVRDYLAWQLLDASYNATEAD